MTSKIRQKGTVLQPVLASSVMKRLDAVVRSVADKDVTVCLLGESGSGKEVLARRIHELSGRRAHAFVPLNCAAIPEALFESELFGHERGAFTGANQTVRGKVEAAAGGTLFLDEIGELPLSLQVKLLRFLEHRRFMRVGGSTKIEADVRLLCATLRPLEEEVGRGAFRGDLFYRIQGIMLEIPPLRERQDDLGPLVDRFLAELTARHGVAKPRLTRAAFAALRAYAWPGNVRELRNVLERLCLLRPGRAVRVGDLPQAMHPRTEEGEVPREAETLLVHLDQPLRHIVDQVLRAAIELEGGNRSRAAQRLGVGLRTIQRRIKESAPPQRARTQSSSVSVPADSRSSRS